jgi:Mg2+/Co2+ transporter CorB
MQTQSRQERIAGNLEPSIEPPLAPARAVSGEHRQATQEICMDPALWLELVVFVVLLGFSGFFSSTETSLFSLSTFQLEQMRAAKNPRIDLIERLRSEPRRLIVTILIGNEFVNVSASVISAAMIIHLFGAENEMINLLVMVPILLLFGEITPKVLAIRNNVAFASVECRPIALVARLITPITRSDTVHLGFLHYPDRRQATLAG